ncbi:hypothetical protein AAFF_G00203110 [Aldrovandia affinis]|uniref:Uncharacterized protein n=1 Tax=Aldrovandia affinis TaxID=143900 RepID=A0AAD7SX26_9TELE|nr:hypothetical protein AAFF_G00203110 [Aldrovandia affinis]
MPSQQGRPSVWRTTQVLSDSRAAERPVLVGQGSGVRGHVPGRAHVSPAVSRLRDPCQSEQAEAFMCVSTPGGTKVQPRSTGERTQSRAIHDCQIHMNLTP